MAKHLLSKASFRGYRSTIVNNNHYLSTVYGFCGFRGFCGFAVAVFGPKRATHPQNSANRIIVQVEHEGSPH
jgi:hypothetical protein